MQIRRRQPNPPVNVSSLQYQVIVPEGKPQNILEEIVWYKEVEIDQMREKLPLLELQKKVKEMNDTPRDFFGAIKQGKTNPSVIAEVKKASPSKGIIRAEFDPVEIAKSYEKGGATCISVLTDEKFFQGSFNNLALVKKAVDLPILCKEFVIYPYQIYLARTSGADAILLIAAILSDQDLQYFVKIINALKMTALIEVHTLEELDRVLKLTGVKLIGINNRNLENFTVDLETTSKILAKRGKEIKERDILVVSESGINTADDIKLVKEAGSSAVLIGESLVKQVEPGLGIKTLFTEI
ncbi:MAG TPA: indole-3-glycerol phosphate synthase TrpC [Allocoleopsis sp.]